VGVGFEWIEAVHRIWPDAAACGCLWSGAAFGQATDGATDTSAAAASASAKAAADTGCAQSAEAVGALAPSAAADHSDACVAVAAVDSNE
jgi:hypothetical protein